MDSVHPLATWRLSLLGCFCRLEDSDVLAGSAGPLGRDTGVPRAAELLDLVTRQSNHLLRGIVTVVSAPENPSADVWRKPRMGGSSQRLGSPLLAHPRRFKRTDDGSGRGRPRGCGAAPGVAIGRSDREPPMKPGVTARTSSPLL